MNSEQQINIDPLRIPQSSEWIDECFLNRITRKVQKDATISIDKLHFDVPMQFIGAKVNIHFRPRDFSSAFVLYEGCKFSLRLTNKVENFHTKHNNPQINYSKIVDPTNVRAFYGLNLNLFDRSITESNHFEYNNFLQMTHKLNPLKEIRVIGLFTASLGMGKSYYLRFFSHPLNPNLYKVVYICLSTIIVCELYKQFRSALGLPEKGGKTSMYKAIQDYTYMIYK